MSDRMSSQQVAHENLNTLAEIMMSDIHGGDSCAHETKSKVVEVPVEAPPKRRRGRPPKGSYGGVAAETIIKKKLAVDDGDGDEDVCFVCFDGGSLVLCDRRGCPKAYHPACIKRDEAFFQSKAKWNCGWHLCNTCQKASYYMCYTCPYSLCKGCTKDADYVSVRGTKGFCGLCLRTIMLIENSVQGSQESAQVDFDDKGSWEYLFKVYWVSLKGELSLTLDELTRAKNPWKGDEAMPQKLGSYHKSLQAVNPKRRKINTQPKLLAGELTINMGKEGRDPVAAWRGNGALNQVDPASAIISNLSNQLMATSETSSACLFRSTGIFSSDLDRIWHYQDPSGKVQGPFSMSQLRKWSMSGYFPSDLRIWRVFERQDSSVLLTDALYVQHDKKLLPSCNSLTHSQDMKSTQPIGVSYSIGQLNNSNALQRDGKNVNKVQQPIQYVIGLKCNNPRSYQGSTRDGIMTSKNGDNFSAERKNRTTTTVQKESKTSEVNQNIKACKFDSQCNNYSERISNNKVDNQSSSQNAGTGVVSMSEQRGSTSQGEDSQGGNVDSTSQPNVFSPSEKCTPYQMKVGSGNENCNPGQINTIGCPSNTAESQINSGSSIDKQSISEDYSSQSSEQSRRPPYMISPLDVWDTKSASAANSYEMSRKNDQVSVPVHSSLTEKPSSENLNDQGIGSREPVSGIRIRDSGPHWSTASSQERVMEQCKEITSEWSRCSPTFYKPGEDLDCSLVSGSNMRPADIVGDHVTTSVSASDQQRHFPESHSASNPSAWQDIVAEPDEFCCLVEESVSDLLAEVEAMESRNANGPGTPTSIMNCGGELTDGSIEYCFSPGGTLSSGGIISPPDPGKVDAFSITDNRKLHSRSTVTDEQNPMKRSDGQICHSNEVERDARNSDVSVNQLELCGVHPSPPSIGDCNTSNTDTSSRHPDSEATGNNLGPVQDNANLSWLNLLKATEPLFGDL